jgi:hypothetical protein
LVDEIPTDRSASDYNPNGDASPRVEAWAVGVDVSNMDIPSRGIAYSHNVTVESTALSPKSRQKVERSIQVVGATVVPTSLVKENDAESQEWIMNT